jgi:hypothetical protein
MRLVQRAMLSESGPHHLAEVLLSGLLRQVTPDDAVDPGEIAYDFHQGVRDVLLDSVRVFEATRVLERVSTYIEARWGWPSDFGALLADPMGVSRDVFGRRETPFARVAVDLLRRLGGRYAELAATLEDRTLPRAASGVHLWNPENSTMSEETQAGGDSLSPPRLERIDQICDRFEHAWDAGPRPRIEDYLSQVPKSERPALFRELLSLELVYRPQNGEVPVAEEYLHRFPEHGELIGDIFREVADLSSDPGTRGEMEPSSLRDEPGRLGEAEPISQRFSEVAELSSDPSTQDDLSGSTPRQELWPLREAAHPPFVGRYRILELLGEGAFGGVYKGYDDQLQREVVVKVHRESQPDDVGTFLAQARVLAGLEHPNIVPLHDFGRTDDGLSFIVSKFIEGHDLGRCLREGLPFSFGESARLVATVAEALHYAHQKGLVHRNVKPSNILIDTTGMIFLVDFALAVVGTPAYMSPEQWHDSGSHRIDVRSDIYSLGVVFYELLTGRRPFQAKTMYELLQQIRTEEPPAPRQLDQTIPAEVERICLKALSKRRSKRYTTAKVLAGELWNSHLLTAHHSPGP